MRENSLSVESLEGLVEFQERIIGRLKTKDSFDFAKSALGVTCGNKRFLFDMNEIHSIIDVPARTRVPKTRSWHMGISNLRGEIYSVIDLKRFKGGESCDVGDQTRLLVIHPRHGIGACLMVDMVVGLVDIGQMTRDGETFVDPDSGSVWELVDIPVMLKSSEFLKIKR